MYDAFPDYFAPTLFSRNGEEWHKRRKFLMPAFKLSILESFIPVIDEKSKILVEELSRCEENGSIDITPLISNCVMETLFATVLDVDTRRSIFDYSAIKRQIDKILDISVDRMTNLWNWPNIIFNFTRNGRISKESLEMLHRCATQIIENRMSEMKGRKLDGISADECRSSSQLKFLDILLNSASCDPDCTLDKIGAEIVLFIITGSDTTSMALIWALYMIGKHPDVLKKLQEELDAVLGRDPDQPITKNDLCDLKYLECVIKETMRMYPVGILIGRKISKEIEIGKYMIPKNTNCLISIQVLHRHPDFFPNPDKFDPERFSLENSLGRHPYAYIPFSSGARNCIGQKFAMMNMKIILARIVQSVTFVSLDQKIGTIFRVTLHPNRPVRLQVKKR